MRKVYAFASPFIFLYFIDYFGGPLVYFIESLVPGSHVQEVLQIPEPRGSFIWLAAYPLGITYLLFLPRLVYRRYGLRMYEPVAEGMISSVEGKSEAGAKGTG